MGFKLASALAAVLVTVIGLGYWYYNSSQATIATLRENNAQLEVAVQTAEDSVQMLQDDIVRLGQLNTQLQTDLQKAEQYGDELRNTLQRHNLTHLASKKPGLIEQRMQGATNKLWNDLADITDPNRVLDVPSGTESSNSN
jgi:FtsZ-binding cell division protein ZapB